MSNEKQFVVIERVYRASLSDVWDLWTTKEGFESWWGPQGFRVEVHEIDARSAGTRFTQREPAQLPSPPQTEVSQP